MKLLRVAETPQQRQAAETTQQREYQLVNKNINNTLIRSFD
jgi:hypothetical protein